MIIANDRNDALRQFSGRLAALLACALCAGPIASARQSIEPAADIAKGIVYHDANGNRQHDDNEQLLAGVAVSNGREIVQTDAAGRYEIPLADESALFLIKPRGWTPPLSDDQLPQFYYLHKSKGSPPLRYPGSKPTGGLPTTINFPLYPQEEPDRFQIVLFGDTQARNLQEIEYIGNDVITELVGTSASFGVTLGDIVFDDLSLFSAHNQMVAQLKIPWINVIGNHDLNYDATDRRYANETYESHYGPSHYSFNFGRVHFVALDDCYWVLATEQEPAHYAAKLGSEQIEFLRNDLDLVPENQMVVLMMHIPITQVVDREEIFRLIERRPLCISISGHTHNHEHHFLSSQHGWRGVRPHHHIVNVTVCGSWWSGQLDERGIPHALMTDGAPNGYSLLTFDGDRYQLDFKAAGRSAGYQMQISTEGPLESGGLADSRVFVNVFNGSERSRVEMRIDGLDPWIGMQRTLAFDPLYRRIMEREKLITPEIQPALAKPGISTHLWEAPLPTELSPGTHEVLVRAIDMDGRTFEDRIFVIIR